MDRNCIFIRMVLIFLFLILIPFPCKAEDLGEISLKKAIQIALEKNLSLKNTREDLEVSKSSLRSTRSTFYPSLDLTGKISQEEATGRTDYYKQSLGIDLSEKIPTGATISIGGDISRTDEVFPAHDETYSTDVSVNFTQPILEGGGIKVATANLRKAKHSFTKQEMSLSLASQSLVLSVTSSYYGILKSGLSLRVRENALEQAKAMLNSAKVKMELGEVAELDLLRADLRVKESENNLITAQQSYKSARDGFLLYLQIDPKTEFDLAEKISLEKIEFTPQQMELDKAVQIALSNRQELKQMELDIKNSELSILLAKNALLNELDLVSSYGLSRSAAKFDIARRLRDKSWKVGLEYRLPFLQYTDKESYIQTQISHRKLLNSFENRKQEIMNEVRDLVRTIKAYEGSLEVLSRALELARESFRLNKLSYDAGLISNVDLLLSQDSLISNENSYFTTLMDYKVALVRLEKALGVLIVNAI